MAFKKPEHVHLPPHIQALKPFLAMEIMERAQELEAQGQHIIHLEIGEPDFDTPSCIKEACQRFLVEKRPHYTHSLGLLELREAICEQYRNRYGIAITPERVLITSGTSPAMLLVFSVLLDREDAVILPDPHYPCYPNYVRYVGAEPQFAVLHEDEGFQYNVHVVKHILNQRTKALVINSPANPTGIITSPSVLAGLSELGICIVSDEIYHGLVYGEEQEHTVLEYTDNAFVINGFSKLYAMTGWRVGYVIAPSAFMRALQTLHQNFFISANSFVQWAALTALKECHTEVELMKATYNERRMVLLAGLRKLGFQVAVEPTGAFYIFANAKRFGEDSLQLAYDMLEGAGVGCTPGIDFGEHGEGFLRFTYANSKENIEEALERMKIYLGG